MVNQKMIYKPNKPWVFGRISINKNLTQEFVKKHINENWRFDRLCQMPIIDLKFVKEFPHIKWNYKYLASNPNISLDMLIHDRLFDSTNESKQNDKFYMSMVTANRSISLDTIKSNPHILKWNFNKRSLDPNLTWEYIHNNDNGTWNFYLLSGNLFLYDKTFDRYKKFMVDIQIQLNKFLISEISKIITNLL